MQQNVSWTVLAKVSCLVFASLSPSLPLMDPRMGYGVALVVFLAGAGMMVFDASAGVSAVLCSFIVAATVRDASDRQHFNYGDVKTADWTASGLSPLEAIDLITRTRTLRRMADAYVLSHRVRRVDEKPPGRPNRPVSAVIVPGQTVLTQPVPTQPVPTQPVPTQPVPTQPVPTQPVTRPWAPPRFTSPPTPTIVPTTASTWMTRLDPIG